MSRASTYQHTLFPRGVIGISTRTRSLHIRMRVSHRRIGTRAIIELFFSLFTERTRALKSRYIRTGAGVRLGRIVYESRRCGVCHGVGMCNGSSVRKRSEWENTWGTVIHRVRVTF